MERWTVWPYVGLCKGPGDPQDWRSRLWSFVRGPYSGWWPTRWYSAYALAPGLRADLALVHYRWGPVKWGLDVQRPAGERR